MNDRPIIFSAPMVRALLDRRKTMTRRLAWRTCKLCNGRGYHVREHDQECIPCRICREELLPSPWQRVRPGDRLWVRESWSNAGDGFGYMADHPGDPRGLGWRPSIHMPRQASRLTLVVTATRIEPVQAISEADALAEGIVVFHSGDTRMLGIPTLDGHAYDHAGLTGRETFWSLWCDLHGPGAWAANPDVVALTFTVHRGNIDRMEAAVA